MKIYLVGGAVRDALLGLPVTERDWVVVGATPEQMLALGFQKVGRDFPVFLHPKTHEEYALARTERKTGKGYTNFVCYSDPKVTLEEDLIRRDLTINAMAQDENGNIIDPYNGRQDLQDKILRHVSPAFAEDPVRILRIARFAARFTDFSVSPETNKLMQQMLAQGEVDALVSERVWQEFSKALGEANPEKFFLVLKDAQILSKLFSSIDKYWDKIQSKLIQCTKLSRDPAVRFAAILFNFMNLAEIRDLCSKYKIPGEYKDLAILTNKLQPQLERLINNNPQDYLVILEHMDVYRRPERLENVILVATANDTITISTANKLRQTYTLTKNVRLTPDIITQYEPQKLRQVLHDMRIAALS